MAGGVVVVIVGRSSRGKGLPRHVPNINYISTNEK